MSTSMRGTVMGGLGGLRHEPTAKRIRAKLGDRVVVDTTRALLLWEPRRVVSSWAVPTADVAADLVPAAPSAVAGQDVGFDMPDVSQRPVLDPSIPFAVHTTPGTVVDVAVGDVVLLAAGLLLADPDLDGYVVLDFDAFTSWWEEEELNIGHPREPFHRIDVLDSTRHVRLELDGELLAESGRPRILFETLLPMRFYLPREDVRAELVPSATTSTCAYKGHATYFSPVVGGEPAPDLAWTYQQPRPEVAAVVGLVAFFDENVDVVLDGEPRERPITPWTRRSRL